MQHWSSHDTPSVSLPSIHELSSDISSPRSEVLSVASFDFAKLIAAAGAWSVVDAMSKHFGITESRMRDIISQSSPVLLRAQQHWMERPGGPDELNKLVRSGGPQQFADRQGLVTASVSRQEGRVYLQYLFLDENVFDMATQQIATGLGIEPLKLTAMMPNLAALFVGVVCKSMTQ